MILSSFSVLWNNVVVFQFNVSLPHCNGNFVEFLLLLLFCLFVCFCFVFVLFLGLLTI